MKPYLAPAAQFQNGLLNINIMDISRQYMAQDSSMAIDTNAVERISEASSGCCAMDIMACLAVMPSAMSGTIVPRVTVADAHIIDVTAIIVVLSIQSSFFL
jgi:hypothetical protein